MRHHDRSQVHYTDELPPEDQVWSTTKHRGLWCVIYGAIEIPLVVCDGEAEASTIASFLNQARLEVADLHSTVWMPEK